jgi:hypothetical protein
MRFFYSFSFSLSRAIPPLSSTQIHVAELGNAADRVAVIRIPARVQLCAGSHGAGGLLLVCRGAFAFEVVTSGTVSEEKTVVFVSCAGNGWSAE